MNNYLNPHTLVPALYPHLLDVGFFSFFFQYLSHFSRFMRNFANLKPRMYSTQFYLSNEIHDNVLSDSSSHKYLYLIVQVFIPHRASIYTYTCKYLSSIVDLASPHHISIIVPVSTFL